jgi:hypothetical protein
MICVGLSRTRSANAFSFITSGGDAPLAASRDRRQVVQTLMGVGTAVIVGPGDAAHAARGAAELDLEYYLRDLFGSNNERLGNVAPSRPPALPAPRTLRDPFLSLLLNDACSKECLPTRVLIDILSKKKSNTWLNDDALEATIVQSVEQYRQRARRSFSNRAAWQDDHVSDQYYFDLTAYALWKTALDLLPDPRDRDVYLRTVGQSLYQQLISLKLLTPPNPKPKEANTLVATNAKVLELLNVFTQYGFIESYTIDNPQGDDSTNAAWLWDAYDDEDLRSGAAVNAVIRLRHAASLGAALQLTGEQSRFQPDFVSPTLCALWQAHLGGANRICTSWESYFLDATYRPNPKGMTTVF